MIHFFFYHIQDKHNNICKVNTTNSNTRHTCTQDRRLNKPYCQWYEMRQLIQQSSTDQECWHLGRHTVHDPSLQHHCFNIL